ncbi:MAG TPA: endolytic transglycosylase MltG [Anaerolineales bacterium]|nr:endolytic transglycosylase MltG [Anaerolineales bacterium]
MIDIPTQPVKTQKPARQKRKTRTILRAILVLLILSVLACLIVTFYVVPVRAAWVFGPASPSLSIPQRIQYSAMLLWYDGLLTSPLNPKGKEETFTVQEGESVNSIASHLEVAELIRSANAFRAYLIYSGLDTTIQSGEYKLSPAMSAIAIARKVQDATPSEVTFVILPGWRMEEIAASLTTSGLAFSPEEFLTAARAPHPDFDFLATATTTEGFLFPDSYIVPRGVSADVFVNGLLRNFALHLTPELTNEYERMGLTTYQAVTLASIVEREAVKDEEKPLIASVYLNRMKINMKLDADPTVQYALGYSPLQQNWWTSPLTLIDLEVNSPYNTYTHTGLPPTPISNPSLESLRAVALPTETKYLYFRAKCDGSGLHEFSETFDEHLKNGCP